MIDKEVRTLYTMYDNRMYCKTTDNEIYYMPLDVWNSLYENFSYNALYEKSTKPKSLGNQLFRDNKHWTICDDSCQIPTKLERA